MLARATFAILVIEVITINLATATIPVTEPTIIAQATSATTNGSSNVTTLLAPPSSKTTIGNTNSINNVGNPQCTTSAAANASSSRGLNINVLPPKILMNYAGIQYPGQLSEAKYRAGENFAELHIQPQNVSANIPSNIVHIKSGSCVQFLIVGTPNLLPPSSLAVTAYHAINGTAAAVLNATDYDKTIFRMNLNSGNYILVAAATWLPGSEDVTGYVIYKFVLSVE